MNLILPYVAGLIFGIGLLISGMTDPQRVLAFLDVAGAWNPALALVMGGAVAVTLPAFAYARRRGKTLGGEALQLPPRFGITPRLVIGSALFGVGWGLSGICPGPAVLIATSGQWQPLLFLGSVIAGMLLYAAFARARTSSAQSQSVTVS